MSLQSAVKISRGRSRKKLRGILALSVFVALSVGCTERKEVEPQQGDIGEPDVDALRALPYLGFSKDKAEEGISGVVHHEPDRAYPGYNLVSVKNGCRADLYDMDGKGVHAWRDPVPCRYWSNAELQPNGDLIVEQINEIDGYSFEDWFAATHLLRLSWDGEVVFKTHLAAHHDTDLTPRGQLLTLHTACRVIPEIDPEIRVRDHGLTLLTTDGEILEEASLYDMLAARPDVFQFQDVTAASTKFEEEDIDLIHANSVEWMYREELRDRSPIYGPSMVLVSMRHQDSIVVLDWDKKEVVWAWGQGEISGQHDATVLENGNFLLFDNGLARGWSRVVELDPLKKEIVWEYRAPNPEDMFTVGRGGALRLPNGNTLITNSDSGHVFEVTCEGEVVWEWYNPHVNDDGYRATVVRMKRYEPPFIEPFLARDGEQSEPVEAAE